MISKASYIPADAINMDSNFHDAEDNVRLGEELLVPEITLRKGERFNPKHKIHEKLIS